MWLSKIKSRDFKQLKQVYNNQKMEAGIAFKGRGDIFSTGLWMTRWVECLPHSFECQSLDLWRSSQSRADVVAACHPSTGEAETGSPTSWNWWALGFQNSALINESDQGRHPRSHLALHIYMHRTYVNMHTYTHTKDKRENKIFVFTFL